MIARICSLLIVAFMATPALAATASEPAVAGLIERIVPERARQFVVETIRADNGRDVFEIESREGKIVLRGNSPLSQAVALNWYLKYCGHCHVSLNGRQLDLPARLPVVKEKVRQVAWAQLPVFPQLLHVRLFDAVVGLDAVGEVHRLDGAQRHQPTARRYRTGSSVAGGGAAIWNDGRPDRGVPARAAVLAVWVDGLPGRPRRAVAQGLGCAACGVAEANPARQRALGMTPVLQGFTGHVPQALLKKFPGAKRNASIGSNSTPARSTRKTRCSRSSARHSSKSKPSCSAPTISTTPIRLSK